MLDWHTDVSDYEEQRYRIIRYTEQSGGDVSLPPYMDPKGIPTIGAGMNLRDDDVLDAVLQTFGFRADQIEADRTLRNHVRDIVSADYPDTKAGLEELRTRLDAAMRERGGDRTTFAFKDPTEVRATFDLLAPTYQRRLDGWAGNSAVSKSTERLALFSLAWNGIIGVNADGSRKSPNLYKAIASGNRAEAWYEIRYNTNKNGTDGIAKRRDYESELFGLYPASDDGRVSSDAAESVYRMFDHHRAHILAYHDKHGDTIAAANRDYDLSGDARVHDLTASLQPALAQLRSEYGDALDPKLASDLGVFDLQVAQKGGDHLVGHTETVGGDPRGRDELLIGSEAGDRLDGGRGADVLRGGAGADVPHGGGSGGGADRQPRRSLPMSSSRSARTALGLALALVLPAAQAGHYVLVRQRAPATAKRAYNHLCENVVKTLNQMKPVRPMVCGFDIPDGTGPVTTPHWHRIDPKAHMDLLKQITYARVQNLKSDVQDQKWVRNREFIRSGQARLWRAQFDLNNKPGDEMVVRHDLSGCHRPGKHAYGGGWDVGTAVVSDSMISLDHAYSLLHQYPYYQPFFYKGRTWLWRWWGSFGRTPVMVYQAGFSRGEFGWFNDAACQIDYVAQDHDN